MLCKGCTVIRAVFHLTSDVAEVCRLAMSFGISGQANENALNKGTPLVTRADGVVGRQPGASFLSSSSSAILFWVPVGITVQAGPRHIVAGLECGILTVVREGQNLSCLRIQVLIGSEVSDC